MEIIINQVSGDTLKIQLEDNINHKILDLKRKITMETGTPGNLIDLYFINNNNSKNTNINLNINDNDNLKMTIKEGGSFWFIARPATHRRYEARC